MNLTDTSKIAAKCGELQKENTEIKAENAALREALTSIAAIKLSFTSEDFAEIRAAQDIARAALT